MNVAVFSTKRYDREFLEAYNRGQLFKFFEVRLDEETVGLAQGYTGVCVFVHDRLDAPVIRALAKGGTKLIALRCAGFNNVDLKAASEAGVRVVRVPAYSPHAVAEHTVGLMLALNRRIHRAHARVHEGNFSLDGLLGFDFFGLTTGIIGTGKIGECVAKILQGFGCRVVAYDIKKNPACEAAGVRYESLDALFAESDVISLHCPLTPELHHLIDREALAKMKRGVMIINTSRGALIDSKAVIDALKSGRVGYLGLDVYEEEADLFFEDFSDRVIQDDVFARLMSFSNVIITGHQAFFTRNALKSIAETTLQNIIDFENNARLANEVTAERVK